MVPRGWKEEYGIMAVVKESMDVLEKWQDGTWGRGGFDFCYAA